MKYLVRVHESSDKRYDVEVNADGVTTDVETEQLQFWRDGKQVAGFYTYVYFKQINEVCGACGG